MSETALVIGFGGKSGVSAVNFLLRNGYHVKANDKKTEDDLSSYMDKVMNKDNVEFHFGHHDHSLLEGVDLVVISPGVPTVLSIIKEAKDKGIQVKSEVELAYQVHPDNWIGITGTDGKSTTTSLIGDILKKKYPDTLVGGNLGIPLTEMIEKAQSNTYVVAELSSFQLENVIDLKPKVGVLINIAKDHLDRYKDMHEYIQAKFNLFTNQTEDDFAVFNYDNKLSLEYLDRQPIKAQKFYFSLHDDSIQGAFLKDGKFCWQNGKSIEIIMNDGEQKIKGEHNKENILAAITIAKLLNIDNENIKQGIINFTGLPHRMELVREYKDRTFFNDSKATTTSAVAKSITGFKNIILIMGGRDKGLDYSELNDVLKNNVKKLILTGEAKDTIKNMIDYPEENTVLIDGFEEAVQEAYNTSMEGDNIILSPACTSYDLFKNFEQRGEAFKRIVNQLV